MKQILILIGILFFIGCGSITTTNNSKVKNHEVETTEQIADSIPPQEENNTLSSIDDIKSYLASNESNYQIVPIQNESEDSVKSYIKANSEYHIEPLQKINVDNNSVQIFYNGNKSETISKNKIYVISDNNEAQIFATFNSSNSYTDIENAKLLLFYHKTFKIPTGFVNIKTDNLTKEILNEKLDKAFNQVGINNLDIENSNIKYEINSKNDGKVLACTVNNVDLGTRIPLYADGSTTLDNNITITQNSNIACGLDIHSSNKIMISDILDFDITDDIDSNVTTTENPNPAIGGTPQENALLATKIKIQGRINNRISHEAGIKVNIDNNAIPVNELNITAVLTDTKHEYNKKFYQSNSVYGGDGRLFKFRNITVRFADERRFKLSYIVENIKTKERVTIDAHLIVTVFGDYNGVDGGTTHNNNSSKFTKANVDIKMYFSVPNTTVFNNIEIKINKNGTYDMIAEIYYNHGLTKYHSDIKTLTVTGTNLYKKQFIIKNLEVRDRPYTLKLTITDKYSQDSVVIEGATFYVR